VLKPRAPLNPQPLHVDKKTPKQFMPPSSLSSNGTNVCSIQSFFPFYKMPQFLSSLFLFLLLLLLLLFLLPLLLLLLLLLPLFSF